MKTTLFILFLLTGCASVHTDVTAKWDWLPDEAPLIDEKRTDFDLVLRGDPVLRMRTRSVPAGLDLGAVAARMEETMNKADGVGIAAPQVGLNIRAAVVMLDARTENPSVIFARNPLIVERSDESEEGWEGCLSVPDVGGKVLRNKWIGVEYLDEQGAWVTRKFEGFNAVVWQHEIDHLDGVLYVDRVQGDLLPWEEVKRRREEENPQ
jgi:peptide deformylase